MALVQYYENGKIMAEIPYSHDKRDGIAKRCDEDGNIVQEVSFSNDRKTGMAKWYYPNGSTLIEIFYENDKITNIKLFYINGNLVIKADYNYKVRLFNQYHGFEVSLNEIITTHRNMRHYNIRELVNAIDNVIIYNTSGTILLELTKDSQKLNDSTLQTVVKNVENHIKEPQGDTWLNEINTVRKFVDALFDGSTMVRIVDNSVLLESILRSLFQEINDIANRVIESYHRCPL